MKNPHGNLYWEIQFDALYNGAEDVRDDEQISVSVRSHDFADAYAKANIMYAKMYHLHPERIYCAIIYLRDDGSINPLHRCNIYATYRIHDADVLHFMVSGPEQCMQYVYRL